MASSSSSVPDWKYDVFLNFRGEDTRRTFIGHLYKALVQNSINTFIDAEQLRKGNGLSQLLTAISDSRLSIVVFSQNYASSTWCLKELVQILQCMDQKKQIVIPIFYEVDPSHVRKIEGSFEEAFSKHEHDPNADMEEVQRWRSALQRAPNLCGWDSQNYQAVYDKINHHFEGRCFLENVKGRFPSTDAGEAPLDMQAELLSSITNMKVGSSEILRNGFQKMMERATEAVESIIVCWPHGDNVVKLNTAFVEMTKLRLLKVYTHYLRPPIRKSVDQWKYEDLKFLFKKLSYLFWDKCPLKSLSSNFNPETLVEIDMQYSWVEHLWKGTKAMVVKAILSDLKQSRHEEVKNEKAVAASRRGGRIWDCICGSRGDGD
ncbi:TMV resistance protein N-like [Pyrus ussuriensis x Pyrus communis]|uniref:TMV resistance protein N-like n=1 Tax=Pyrus ussuriensis x Pyrus communis TaxID=2448454 RepID=A0A5N5HGP2_9ROSA|nr:TMV resistance protein N-like [Pyrus ussuriensis x Pyrus communis]